MDHLLLLMLLWSSGLRAEGQHNQTGARCETTEKADIVLLLDDSGSIEPDDFKIMKSFVAEIVRAFNIGPDAVQIGLVQYSDVQWTEWHLNTHQTKQSLLEAVGKLIQKGGGTETGRALDHVFHHNFKPSVGMRTDSKHILILITDGQSQDEVLIPSMKLKNSGVEIYAIGVRNAKERELISIASDPIPIHKFLIRDFQSLQPMIDLVTIRLCNSIKSLGQTVRLVNGSSLCSGRLEVKSNQSWSSVCEEDFDQQDAEVVCRELGCGAPSGLQGALYGGVGAPTWTKEFQCEGNESALLDCRSSSARNTSSPGRAVGLTCSEPVRLVGGSGRCAGALELKLRQWRPVSFLDWMGAAFCRELNCGDFVSSRVSEPISLKSGWGIDHRCVELEFTLKECIFIGPYSSIVELTCSEPVRLVGGSSRCAGTLEVKRGRGGWRPGHGDDWTLMSAAAVCRALDCGSAVSTRRRHDSSITSAWKILSECLESGSAMSDCLLADSSSYITEITCSDSVRLVNGSSLCAGRLEVKSNQSWSSVCEEDFDQQDAEVVCREFGCGAPSGLQGALYGGVEAPMWTKEFQCEGTESALLDCRSSSARNTSSPGRAVGLTCSEPVRLVGGYGRCAGTLELNQGEWRPVHDFTLTTAAAVCRALDCGSAVSTRTRQDSSNRSTWEISSHCVQSGLALRDCVSSASSSSIMKLTCSDPAVFFIRLVLLLLALLLFISLICYSHKASRGQQPAPQENIEMDYYNLGVSGAEGGLDEEAAEEEPQTAPLTSP